MSHSVVCSSQIVNRQDASFSFQPTLNPSFRSLHGTRGTMFQKTHFTGTNLFQCFQWLGEVLFQCSNVPAKKDMRGGGRIIPPAQSMQNTSTQKNSQKGIRRFFTGTLEQRTSVHVFLSFLLFIKLIIYIKQQLTSPPSPHFLVPVVPVPLFQPWNIWNNSAPTSLPKKSYLKSLLKHML